jgi:hypothetical protein
MSTCVQSLQRVAVNVTVPREIKNRESAAATIDEARTILRAATAVKETNKAFDAAKRWVPWLCAYSGASCGEITQLRGIDIEQRGDFHRHADPARGGRCQDWRSPNGAAAQTHNRVRVH